jgi:hypothetical protein
MSSMGFSLTQGGRIAPCALCSAPVRTAHAPHLTADGEPICQICSDRLADDIDRMFCSWGLL